MECLTRRLGQERYVKSVMFSQSVTWSFRSYILNLFSKTFSFDIAKVYFLVTMPLMDFATYV